MEITDSMRAAVLAEQCQQLGHDPDFGQVRRPSPEVNPHDPRGIPLMEIRADDSQRMPHIVCARCGIVWLIIDEPGDTYEHAVERLAERFDVSVDDPKMSPRWDQYGPHMERAVEEEPELFSVHTDGHVTGMS